MPRLEGELVAIRNLLGDPGMERELRGIAEKIQDRAALITAAEAVDTGLMAASWRVVTIPAPRGWIARVWNRAESEDGYAYPAAVEWGYRHHRSGRHIPGRRFLGRAIDAARTT